MELKDVEVGKKYSVTLSDCCIQGYFVSVVKGKIYLTKETANMPGDIGLLDSVEFENGVILTEFLGDENILEINDHQGESS